MVSFLFAVELDKTRSVQKNRKVAFDLCVMLQALFAKPFAKQVSLLVCYQTAKGTERGRVGARSLKPGDPGAGDPS